MSTTNHFAFCLILAVLGHMNYVQILAAGPAAIHLDVMPHIIDVDLTKEMNMSCSLDNSTSTVSHLVSIVISRIDDQGNERLVASVSSFDLATAVVDAGIITVHGTVAEPMVSKNYLRLTWDHPGTVQASHYKCDINAIDKTARPILFTTNYTVVSRQPEIESIVKHIRVLEESDEVQRREIDQLKQLTSDLKTRLAALEGQSAVVG